MKFADCLAELWKDKVRWQAAPGNHPHEAAYLKLDCSKTRSLLGWSPRLNLRTTLAWVAEWYQAYAQNADMREYTETQIAQYENLPQTSRL